jgi:hypothetical protein
MPSVRGNVGPYAMLIAGLQLLVDTSCAKMIPVPEAERRKTDPARNETYHLTTKGGRIYEFKRFAVTDSTLVILEIKSYGKTPSFYEMDTIRTPIAVPWTDVASLERLEYRNRATVLVLVGVMSLVTAGILWVLALGGLEGLSGS